MSSFPPHLNGWYDVADQMRADLQRRAQKLFQERQNVRDSLTTGAEFEAHRERTRARFLESIGGLPTEKTPLQAQVTGTFEQEGFKIEKVLFQSLPNFFVSAACYVPDGLDGPAPGVLFFCGHSGIGKAAEAYQKVCRDLARNGFVVLAVDPIGQGERLQYWKDKESLFSSCTIEHTHAGFPYVLMGASVARHFVWDGIRAFDYLASRPDVDENRIGATGNSGGGTQTSLLMLAEPRLASAVPATFPMTLETMMKVGQAQDMEQIVPRSIAGGPDHDDFLTALAPKPVMAGAVAYDFFPIEGTHEAVNRARKVYELYGQAENVQINVDDSLHCYSDGTRQACVNWFRKHLKNEAPDFVTEDPGFLPEERLWATKSGQVLLDIPESKTVTDFTREYLAELPKPSASPDELRVQLDQVLGVSQSGDRSAIIYPRINLPEEKENGATAQRIWFFSAPDVCVAGELYSPSGTEGKVLATTLLVHDASVPETSKETVKTLLSQGRRVFVYDVRGVGRVASRSVSPHDLGGEKSPFNTEYKMACDAMMMEQSTLGLRVFDLLRGLDYLKTRSDVGEISLHGTGDAATWAYFAAALEPDFVEVTCEDMLVSYKELCRTYDYDSFRFNLKIMAWGLLRVGDILDFVSCISPRKLNFIAPRDARGELRDEKEWDQMVSERLAMVPEPS